MKSTKAFTLVELLVVIAIISVLAAMLLPSLEQGLRQARILVCSNNLRQLDLAVQMYGNDCRGYMPRPWNSGYEDVFKNLWFHNKPMGIGALFHHGYMQDGNVAICPDSPLWRGAAPPKGVAESLASLRTTATWPTHPYYTNYNVALAYEQRTLTEGQAALRWGLVNIHYNYGIAETMRDNLPGGRLWDHGASVKGVSTKRLRTPRPLVACGFPNIYRSYANPHAQTGVNVLYANGRIHFVMPEAGSTLMRQDVGSAMGKFSILERGYPDYQPPR